jgi:DNA polymerase-1
MGREEKKKIFIIDGFSNIYRAYYAIRGLTTKKGLPTNAVFGFVQMLRRLLSEYHPDYLCVAFDTPGPTVRHEEYKEYKAHRKPMPEDLVPQIPYVKRACEAMRVPIVEMQGFEGDDVIGTLAQKAVASGLDVIVVTIDKDMFQLVRDGVSVLQSRGEDQLYDSGKVQEIFGVKPAQVTDVMGLWGDASDNIPGVPGIGEKGSKALIREFGSLENCLAHVDTLEKKKLAESLKAFREQAILSKKLATIVSDLPIEFDLETFRFRDPDRDKIHALFRELEFTSLLSGTLPDVHSTPRDYRIIWTEEDLLAEIRKIRKNGFVSVDTETDSRDPMRANIVGVSLSLTEWSGCYVPVGHDYLGAPVQLPLQRVLLLLSPILQDPAVRKIGQNIKYEIVLFKNYGIELKGAADDTMVGSYLLNPSKAAHNLDAIAEEHLGYKTITYDEVAGKGKNRTTLNRREVDVVAEYAIEDADVALRASRVLKKKMEQEGLLGIYSDMEMPLIEVLSDMEFTGVKIDAPRLAAMGSDLEKKMEQLTAVVYEKAGQEFNINSPRQLSEILFTKLKLEPVKKTRKTGSLSTGIDVLEQLAANHELPRLILEYRQMAKLKGTYVDTLPSLTHPRTGRVHTSFNQTVTATGRLSSSDPNLQNIPVRTELGKKIREAFITDPGRLLLSADYSQIELRVLAHLSRDEKLVAAFQAGRDIHTQTAAEVFGVDDSLVSEEMRRRAKVINFGIIYGMSAFGLARQLGISRTEAAAYIDRYFERYPGIRRAIDEGLKEARESGVVRTMFGRLRKVPELKSPNAATRQLAERIAINTPIQGTAADFIKIAMIRVFERLRKEGFLSRMILQVHDELVLEVPEDEIEKSRRLVTDCMEGIAELRIPLKVDCGVGRNWLEAGH